MEKIADTNEEFSGHYLSHVFCLSPFFFLISISVVSCVTATLNIIYAHAYEN